MGRKNLANVTYTMFVAMRKSTKVHILNTADFHQEKVNCQHNRKVNIDKSECCKSTIEQGPLDNDNSGPESKWTEE